MGDMPIGKSGGKKRRRMDDLLGERRIKGKSRAKDKKIFKADVTLGERPQKRVKKEFDPERWQM